MADMVSRTEPGALTRLLFVGDIGLGGDFADRYGHSSPAWIEPFLEVSPVFEDADLRIGNLESPLFESATPRPKRNLLGASPDSAEALSYLGFDALSLGNNHITDQGTEGITKTRGILESRGIAAFGAGEDLGMARKPAFVRTKNQSFAFLGYAVEGQDVGAEMATNSREGCVPLSPEYIESDIASAREKAEHVIVSLHWGYQYDQYPDPGQIRMARRIIDYGATIVHGHHPHVLQGMERYKDGLILYSLGNFFFPDFVRTDGRKFRFPRQSHRTAAVVCDVGFQGVLSVSMVPMLMFPDLRMRVLRGRGAASPRRSFVALSSLFDTQDYSEHWSSEHRRTERRRRRYDERFQMHDDTARLWRRVRTRGFASSLRRLKGRHAKELFRRIRRYTRNSQAWTLVSLI